MRPWSRAPARALLVLLTLAVGLFGSSLSDAANRSLTVNCGLGDTIASALAAQRPADTLTVTLAGGVPCVENVVIRNNDVTLKAAAAPAPVAVISAQEPDQPTILIDGALRVTLTRLLVRNGSPGVQAIRGASVSITGSRLNQNNTFGIVSSHGATVELKATNVDANDSHGVLAVNGGTLAMTGGSAKNNAGIGIVASRSSTVRVGQNAAGTGFGAVTVTRNGAGGVSVNETSSLILVRSDISNNTGGNGVSVSRSSSARIGIDSNGVSDDNGNTVRGNQQNGISVFQASQALIVGNTINSSGSNGVAVTMAAAATLLGNAIADSASRGVVVSEAASARIGVDDASTSITGNTIQRSGSDGVGVFNSANARLGGNTVSTSTGRALNISQATASLVGANVLQTSTSHGIEVTVGGALSIAALNPSIARDNVRQNAQAGLNAFNNGTVHINGPVTIQQNGNRGVSLGMASRMFIRNATIQNNTGDGVALSNGAQVHTGAAPAALVVTGNTGFGIQCFNGALNFGADTSGVTGNTQGQVQDCDTF